MTEHKIINVVTGFLTKSGEILILKRSDKVGSYNGKWAGVSGFIEENSTPDEQMLIEILEETSLTKDDISLLKKGDYFDVPDSNMNRTWRVHTYLFKVQNDAKISIDWEHDEFKWINPSDLEEFDTVPSLDKSLNAVIQGLDFE